MPYKDREKANANSRAWRKAHPENGRRTQRAWRAANPGKSAAYAADYRRRNPEKAKASLAASRAAHPEKARAYGIERRKRFPEEKRMQEARRRARKLQVPVNDLTGIQWLAIKAHYGNRCVYCGRKMQRLTQDHITPLSKGGSHTLSNVVPACQRCNSKKGVKSPLIPIQPLLLI